MRRPALLALTVLLAFPAAARAQSAELEADPGADRLEAAFDVTLPPCPAAAPGCAWRVVVRVAAGDVPACPAGAVVLRGEPQTAPTQAVRVRFRPPDAARVTLCTSAETDGASVDLGRVVSENELYVPLTRRGAVDAVEASLERRYGRAWRRGSGRRVTCRVLTAEQARCTARWRTRRGTRLTKRYRVVRLAGGRLRATPLR